MLQFPGKAGLRLRDRLAGFFTGAAARLDEDGVRALHEISLTIQTGERVGVIGWNGAGKTTLLKTMCGIYTPSEGNVRVEGDVASLFELATGFEMEASGYDNMLTRALLLGKYWCRCAAARHVFHRCASPLRTRLLGKVV